MKQLNRLLTLLLLIALTSSACQPIQAPAAAPVLLIQGAGTHGAGGMAVDAQGQLWVAHLLPDTISAIDPATGEQITQLDATQGIVGPSDLLFAADGTLYWVSWFAGLVGAVDSAGNSSVIAQLPPGASAIVQSEDGRLFVASCGMGDSAIYEISPGGDAEPRLIVGDLPACALAGADWGADGYLYGARSNTGEVVRVDVATGAMTTVLTGLARPTGAKFDAEGRLIVTAADTGEVMRCELATNECTVLTTLGPGQAQPVVDAQGHLYVANLIDGSIVEVLAEGQTRTVSAAGLIMPGGIAVVGDRLYVADFLAVRTFDRSQGQPLGMIYRHAGSDLRDPLTVAPDGENLLLTSWVYNTVQVLDPATQEIVATYDDFAVPMDAIRFQGDLIVAELETGSVVRAHGADPTVREPLATALAVPTGLAATDDDLWVADMATGTVWQLVADGAVLAEPLAVATALAAPEGLAATADGRLVVVEAGAGRVTVIDPATGAVTPLAEGLALGIPAGEGIPPTWIFNGVAVTADGQIYVTGEKTNVVYHLALP
jgi:DNA-binding beta-propeller fold protein YncE